MAEDRPTGSDADALEDSEAFMRAIAAAPPRAISSTRRVSLEPGVLVDGTFRIEAKLGAGAMGVVYLATDVSLDRQVALKLHSSANDDPRASRMWREAKAMARLSHPNVVAVHEVGVFDDRVYIAMELVTGGTLRDWLAVPRSWRDVLGVFRQAGRGLAAAHQVGLVHRDFKPTNALIDDAGRVRVADFGLARAAIEDDGDVGMMPTGDPDASPSLDDRLTQTGAAVGTPAYMAPEQLEGRRVDHRADQFAFCVALHEAMYGVHPFEATSMHDLLVAATQGRVRQAPSDRSVPAWVRAVLLRGLAPDPEDRFASMDALVDALGRDPSTRRRIVAGSVLGSVALAGLLFGVARASSGPDCSDASAGIGEIWNASARGRVEDAMRATGLPFAEATAVRVREGLDDYAQAWADVAVDACERGDVELSPALRESQVLCLQSRQRATKAAVDLLSRIDGAQVAKAVRLVERLPSVAMCDDVEYLAIELEIPSDPAVAQSVEQLRQRLDAAKALYDAGTYADGLATARSVVDDARALSYGPVLAEALLRHGLLAEQTGDYASARSSLQEAYEEAIVAGHEEVATDASIALIHVIGVPLAQHDAALQWRLHARAHGRRIGFFDGREGTLENAVAAVHQERGKFDLAFEHFENARTIWERDLPGDELRLSRIYNNLGGIERRRSNLEQAQRWFTRALEHRERHLGPDHPLVATVLMGLGNVAFLSGERPLAIERYRRALSIREAALGPEHPDVAGTLTNLGVFLQYAGEFDEALEVQQRALRIEIATKGEEHPAVATCLENIGSVHWARGNYDEAADFYEQALKMRERTLGEDHVNVSVSLTNLAQTYEELGRWDEAIELQERSLAIKRANLDPDHPQISGTLEAVGNAYFRKSGHEEALSYYQQAFEMRQRTLGPDHPDMLLSHANIGNALEMLGRLDEALLAHEKALKVAEQLAESDPKYALAVFNLGQVYRMRGEANEALPHLELALKLRTENETPPALIADTRFELAQALRLAGKDAAMARQQASKARDGYAELGLAKLREDVEAWLQAHS